MLIVSHPTGNENVRNALQAFSDNNMLDTFWTTVAWHETNRIGPFIPRTFREHISRRAYPAEFTGKIRTNPFLEYGRILSEMTSLSFLTKEEDSVFSIDKVYRDLDIKVARHIKRSAARGVYAYEDGAFHAFLEARLSGLKCFYDLPIGYWRAAKKLLEEEALLKPDWAGTITIIADSENKLLRKDREIELSDMVLVPSNFVRDSLASYPLSPPRIEVVPYGCHASSQAAGKDPSGKLKVIFVGALTQRKGISYLFDAVKEMGRDIELTLIGGVKPGVKCAPLFSELKDHRTKSWLPRHLVLEEIRKHDVLVLPSLFEGLSLVVLEALSEGIPVIVTPNTGCADIIKDGHNGFIVPIRSPEAIAEKLNMLYTKKGLLRDMGCEALKTARANTWLTYQDKLVKTVLSIL